MELRDIVALSALVISMASLAFSIRTFSFNRRVKAAELRASVLGRAAEILGQLNSVRELNARILEHANAIGDSVGSDLVSQSRVAEMQSRFDQIYAGLIKAPMHLGLDMYERFFHDFTALREDTLRLEQQVQQNCERYVVIRQGLGGGA